MEGPASRTSAARLKKTALGLQYKPYAQSRRRKTVKSQDKQKGEEKKKAQKSLKEKRAEKKAKKESKNTAE